MRRGDIYQVNFEPSVQGEPARTRPAVVITNDLANGLAPKVGRFRVETWLRSRVQHRLSFLAQGTV